MVLEHSVPGWDPLRHWAGSLPSLHVPAGSLLEDLLQVSQQAYNTRYYCRLHFTDREVEA